MKSTYLYIDLEIEKLKSSNHLSKLDCDVVCTNNGQESFFQYLENPLIFGFSPDLILLKNRMPCMNGSETARAIQSVETKRSLIHCPLVCLTGDVVAEVKVDALNASMDGFLTSK
ncbi:hypothetical protein GEMRC1_013771 [Eukaryota sp. GEM-RC1]